MGTVAQGVVLLPIIAASIVVFLLLRWVVCWYFKINERVDINREILELLKARYNVENKNDV